MQCGREFLNLNNRGEIVLSNNKFVKSFGTHLLVIAEHLLTSAANNQLAQFTDGFQRTAKQVASCLPPQQSVRQVHQKQCGNVRRMGAEVRERSGCRRTKCYKWYQYNACQGPLFRLYRRGSPCNSGIHD